MQRSTSTADDETASNSHPSFLLPPLHLLQSTLDPTYMIRAIPTNSADRIYCKILGQGAVHGAFAGYTDFTVGLVNTHYVYLPIPVIIQAPRVVDPQGRQWNRLKTAIKQPDLV